MKPETFYRKYANLPTTKRFIQMPVMTGNGYQSYSPQDIYESLNVAMDNKYKADAEVKRLLIIGEVILH